MFRNKVTILITVGVLVAIAIGLQFINRQSGSLPDAIGAIPEDAAIVIETENLGALLKSFNETNLFKREFSEMTSWRPFFKDLEYMDSLVNKDENIANMLDGNKVIISGHLTANDEIDFLFAIPVKDKENQDEIIKIFGDKVGADNIQKGDYEGAIIYNASNLTEDTKLNNFSFAFSKNIFILSKSRICIEESIRMLNEGFSIIEDKSFLAARKTAGKNVDANIYINYKHIQGNILSSLNNESDTDEAKENARKNARFADFLGRFAAWTALDLKLKNDAFVLSGFTIFSDSLNNYLNAFKGQKPVDNDFISNLPSNTSAFISFNLSDCKLWKEKYSEYLSQTDNFNGVNNYFETIRKKRYKIADLREFFYNNIEGGVTIAWLNQNLSEGEQNVVGIVQLKDAEKMKEMILQVNPTGDDGKIKVSSSENIDPKAGVIAYSFPEPQILTYLFGDAFKPLRSRFYVIDDDKLVFAESVGALQLYYQKSKKGAALSDDKDFNQYSKSLASESNIFIYTNIAKFGMPLANELKKNYADIYKKNSSKFNKIQAASIQFGMGGNQMFTNVYINFSQQFAKKSKNLWEVTLDTSSSAKPEIVKNFSNGNNQVLIQDDGNKLVFIDESGKILWKKQIEGKILGTIHQVDLLKNNKIQYMFNTSKQIHVIDRNGHEVDGFPVTFKSPATNGMAVFDYDKDRNYRLLIACENRKVYLLTETGRKVDGWAFNETQSEVIQPAQHFIVDSKDYIIFSDKTKTYVLNRKGETRIDVKSPFERSNSNQFYFERGNSKELPSFLTTSKNGDVYFIFLDGQVKRMTFDGFNENHNFIYTDLDGDGKNYFIYAEKNKLIVYNRDKSVRFENKFDENIENTLSTYRLGKNLKYLGVAPVGENKIYLLTNEGKDVKGFPMIGNGKFSISKLINSKDNDGLNLIVGGNGKFLYNYYLNLN